ncbi:MAG: HAMP domain-containing histidine kinase [Nitrosomonadales bacterium]|nr:HAMP domain-containing histidine kinase [Nitrosomonadales bacterium]
MLYLKNVSLKYKIPLRVTVLVSVTAFVLASTLVYRGIEDLRSNLIANADRMGRVIADTLVQPMLHDDVWRSLEIINTPFRIQEYQAPDRGAEYILILNAANKVYVATQPERFPMLSDPVDIEPRYTEILKALPDLRKPVPTVVEPYQSDNLLLLIPIQSDGMRLGTLVMSYPKSPFTSRFYSLTQGAILTTLLVIIVLLPLGMYWGRKMAAPLLQLSDAMRNITPNLPEPGEIILEESNDEIGQLGKAFKGMLAGLKEKEQLQQQVISSNRLAAIGRLTAGIAHEINNPLGGMLNAISTYKRHGTQDALTLKTLSILERGLIQIKETVAALLVEAKSKSRPFDRNDVEDIRTLIQPDVKAKHINFTGEIDIAGIRSLPSTLVRQVIINLLLNAVQATQEHGQVRLDIHSDNDNLVIDVANSGSHIPQGKIAYLFEPFTSLNETGRGLGLWVIYQIVQQLDGQVSVQSVPDETRFVVQLPLQRDNHHE